MINIKAIIKPPPRLIATVKKVDKVIPPEQQLTDILTIYRLAKI